MTECRIIIVDDQRMFTEGLKALIHQDKRFKVVAQVDDCESLVSALKNNRCDLVIVEISMSNGDGLSIIREIRKRYSKIKILVLTMLKDHEHFKHAIANGASGYVLKEESFEQLLLAIKLVLKGKRFVSKEVATLITDRYVRSIEDFKIPSLEVLTKRELRVLELIAQGRANKNIASVLSLSTRTVETHRANLTNKLGIKSTAGLVKFAINKGLA